MDSFVPSGRVPGRRRFIAKLILHGPWCCDSQPWVAWTGRRFESLCSMRADHCVVQPYLTA